MASYLQQFVPHESTADVLKRQREAAGVKYDRRTARKAEEMGLEGNIGFSMGRKSRRGSAVSAGEDRQSQEYKMAQLGQNINVRLQQIKDSPEYAALGTDEERANLTNKIGAEEASKLGMHVVASQLLSAYNVGEQDRKRKAAELAKLNAQQGKAEADRDKAVRSLDEVNYGEATEVWVQDRNGTWGPTTGIMNPDQTVTTGDGRRLKAGDYLLNEPPLTGEKKLVEDADAFIEKQYSKSERKKVRDLVSAASDTLYIQDRVLNVIAEAVMPDGTVDILGTAGKAAAGAQGILDTVRTGGRILGRAGYELPIVDSEDKVVMSRSKIRAGGLKEYLDEYVGEDRYDTTEGSVYSNFLKTTKLRDVAQNRAKFDSLISQLAYAKARSVEPGSTRLSDNDVKFAFTMIGGALSDPRALMDVMTGNADQVLAAVEEKRRQLYFPEYGDRVWKRIVGGGGDLLKEREEAYRSTLRRFAGTTSPSDVKLDGPATPGAPASTEQNVPSTPETTQRLLDEAAAAGF